MPPSTPPTPKSQFDFIMQNGQAPKKGLGLPLPNIPKPLLIGIVVIILFIIFRVIANGISNSNKPDYSSFVSAMSRAQEIARVSTLVENIPQTSSTTQNLASTTSNVLNSWQSQLAAYLTPLGVVATPGSLTGDNNPDTDMQMKNAATNDNLDSVYVAYLQSQLASYTTGLQVATKVAGPHGKALISQDIASTKVILSSLQVASSN